MYTVPPPLKTYVFLLPAGRDSETAPDRVYVYMYVHVYIYIHMCIYIYDICLFTVVTVSILIIGIIIC